MGDDVENAIVGNRNKLKHNEQPNQAKNTNNIYLDSNNEQRSKQNDIITLDERLDRMEQTINVMGPKVDRVMRIIDGISLVDNNSSYQIAGLPAQLSAYMKSDQEWKEATQARILLGEKKLNEFMAEAEKKTVPIAKAVDVSPKTSYLIMIIIVLAAMVILLTILHFRGSGTPIPDDPARVLSMLVGGCVYDACCSIT